MKYIGHGVPALNNRQLAAGKGTFVGDIHLDRMLHLAVVRSPYAHARIRGIDTRAAEAVTGVVYVITGKEVAANMNHIMEAYDTAAMGAKGMKWYALCPERVRFVGRPSPRSWPRTSGRLEKRPTWWTSTTRSCPWSTIPRRR